MEPVLWRSLTSSPKSSRISRSTRTSRRILASQVPSAWPSAWARWVLPTPLVIHGLIFEWPLSCRSLGSCDLCNERPAVVAACGSAGLSAVGVNMTSMKLETMAEEDVELRMRLETDPQMMADLGGPRRREAIERAHAKSLALAVEGRCWPLKVVPDGASSPAGWVDVFESSHEDEAIYEIGWMILPDFQNRGIASQAVREVLEKARVERVFGQIHAFPAVTNGPSNKICEKNGFTNLGECEVEFAGRGLRCNHWRIDLF